MRQKDTGTKKTLSSRHSKLPDVSNLIPTAEEKSSRWMLQMSREVVNVWKGVSQPFNTISGNTQLKGLTNDFFILESTNPINASELIETIFPRWFCPLHHQWPTKPHAPEFVEKAAQGLIKKMGTDWEHLEILSTSPHLKKIVIGLKGRLIQLKTQLKAEGKQETSNQLNKEKKHETPESLPIANTKGLGRVAHSKQSTPLCETDTQSRPGRILAVLIDEKGLYAGTTDSRIDMGSALAGGLGFLDRQSTERSLESKNNPSRASGKIREVLALLELRGITAEHFKYWLELGAAPGGMTQHLLDWGAEVAAVDLADLSDSVLKHPKVKHLRINASELSDAQDYHALLSDMNGPFLNAAEIVSELASTMKHNALIIFTLKLREISQLPRALEVVNPLFKSAGIKILLARHLFHNRTEITLIGQRKKDAPELNDVEHK